MKRLCILFFATLSKFTKLGAVIFELFLCEFLSLFIQRASVVNVVMCILEVKARYSVLRGSYYGFQTMIFTFQMNCFDQHCMNCINIIANPIFLAVETWDNQSSETMSFEIGGKTKRSRDHWDEEYDEGKVKKVKKHHGHPSSKKSSHGNQFQKLQDRRNNEKVGKL